MPVYEYQCQTCGKTFSQVMSVKEKGASDPHCPHCGGRSIKQSYGGFYAKSSKKS
ncbi:MAG TPA: zinc ribbon domain-containing protein [Dissulfurispiraceae bacterium]|nr:zinc ribbon domain-containing protein [Dissulfurispiraceae bacterium]